MRARRLLAALALCAAQCSGARDANSNATARSTPASPGAGATSRPATAPPKLTPPNATAEFAPRKDATGGVPLRRASAPIAGVPPATIAGVPPALIAGVPARAAAPTTLLANAVPGAAFAGQALSFSETPSDSEFLRVG